MVFRYFLERNMKRQYQIVKEEEWAAYNGLGGTTYETLETWYRVVNKDGKPLQRYWTKEDAKLVIKGLKRRYGRGTYQK